MQPEKLFKICKKTSATEVLFSKTAGWKMSQNPQEVTCAGVSFWKKLLGGGTISTPNCWYACISESKFFVPFNQFLLLITGKSGDCLHQYHVKNSLLEIPQISIIWVISLQRNNFSQFRVSIAHSLIDFTNLERFLSKFEF